MQNKYTAVVKQDFQLKKDNCGDADASRRLLQKAGRDISDPLEEIDQRICIQYIHIKTPSNRLRQI